MLSVPPGMTSPTALAFADEEQRLAAAALAVARAAGRGKATEDDVETAYRSAILPQKLRMDASYVQDPQRTWRPARDQLGLSA